MNTLEESDNALGSVHYEPLLKAILEVLKHNASMFHAAPTCLTVHVDEVASAVATKIIASNNQPLFENTWGTRSSSVNFADVEAKRQFATQVERIKDQLQTHLETELKSKLDGMPISRYATSLLSEAQSFKGAATKGLHYPFEAQSLAEERLRLRSRGSGDHPWLKGHKLTISIGNINGFDTQLVNGIYHHLEDKCDECSEDDLENTRAVLERDMSVPESELNKLKRLVSKESLGRLQKEAKIRYLEFLSEGIKQSKSSNEEGFKLLQNMIRRLRLLEAFINDPTKPDGYYNVNYSGATINYRDLFSRADAFDMLPVIADIEGALGETFDEDKGEQAFTSGIKLKLNGPVQTHKGEAVFDYYLTLLDPGSEEHKQRMSDSRFEDKKVNQRFVEKVLKIELLYYFVFLEMNNAQFDPAARFEKTALPALQDQDEQAKVEVFKKLNGYLRRSENSGRVEVLKGLLQRYITNPATGPERRAYPIHLSLGRGILEQDGASMVFERKFFKDVLAERWLEALKYITIEEASAGGDAFCTLPVSIVFEPLYYFSAQEAVRNFNMAYDLQGIDMLPVLLVPGDEQIQKVCAHFYSAHKRIVLHYQHILLFKSNSPQAFVYHFTFLLLAYTCLKMLLDSTRKGDSEHQHKLFVPIVLLHMLQKVEESNSSTEGTITRSLSKVLAHMLAQEYLSNSQGFYVNDLEGHIRQSSPSLKYKLPNGLSSLYSVLPKRFHIEALQSTSTTGVTQRVEPGLDKLAIVIVSSRKSDFNVKVPSYVANVFGEVIGIERLEDSSVRLETLRTFSTNQESSSMYRVPTAISDEVEQCYRKGYRHFLYIARAPYSSMLHITRPDEDEELFFMSKDIIQALMRGRSDIKIYPLYCDKYFVVNLRRGQKTPALYVDDTADLTSLVTDPHQSSVVFFNLINGITVSKHSLYNGVVSYATLVNMYDNITYDQYIRANLLDGNQPGSLKGEILDFLKLVHFSRYEKEKSITFKLEPYQNIIGDDSVGSLSLFTHAIGFVRFNSLAFLTEVKGVLNRQGVVAVHG